MAGTERIAVIDGNATATASGVLRAIPSTPIVPNAVVIRRYIPIRQESYLLSVFRSTSLAKEAVVLAGQAALIG